MKSKGWGLDNHSSKITLQSMRLYLECHNKPTKSEASRINCWENWTDWQTDRPKHIFHWSENPLTPTNTCWSWEWTQLALASGSNDSAVDAAPAPICSDGNITSGWTRQFNTTARWEQVSVVDPFVTSNVTHRLVKRQTSLLAKES